jgi:alpha-ketoglutaric semialdehyde dehydrogenase
MATELRSCSPQRPDDVVVTAAEVPPATVATLAETARDARRGWWAAPVATRADALTAAAAELEARRDEAAALVVREVGKPVAEARGEVARAVGILRYYAQTGYLDQGTVFPAPAPSLIYTQRRPHGVAGLITPWNFPLAIPLWKAAPALACGNAVLLKPATAALGCARLLADVLGRHLPEGLFQVVAGEAETATAVIAEADVVSFTGSTAVGRRVRDAAAAAGHPVQCEMGGLNAAVVLPDADPEHTAGVLAAAAMGYAGQKCTATRRIVTVGDRPDLVEALLAAVDRLPVGDPADPAPVAGPVIAEGARSAVVEATAAARAAGGRVLRGGHALDHPGWYVEPTVLTDVPPDRTMAREEIFGPLTLLYSVPDLSTAIEFVNASRYGLVTSVHGRDVDALMRAADGIDTGMVKVNAPTTGVDFWAPFGGEKDSSYGQREQGTAALSFYSTTRTVTVSPHTA